MTRTSQPVPGAPVPGGPYSANSRIGRMVAIAGQCGYRPDRSLPDSLEEQVEIGLDNLSAALTAAGVGESDVLSTQVYLAEPDDFAAMNAVYEQRFTDPLPPRTTIVAGLRPGVLFEINALAVVPEED